ncbi:unnamed protein product [Allacma fusca]|uniref:Nuclear cap-binding protein subunit 1 n=1 Tax=Allacma fusca TaxID=39272 RepID=A0A8J2JIU6_9HEXA|nr:unnamed protein product [Allacma fusca]
MNRGKRRQYDDDEQGGGGGGRYFAKRQRTTYSQNTKKDEDPIKSVILEAGERSKTSLESSIESVAKMLDGDLAQQKAKILQTLVEVVTTLPEKCSIYATLVGLLNAKNYGFGGEFVESVVKSFKEFLRNGNWTFAQYTLRFISDLVNCHVVSATSLLQLYDTFMEGALDPNVPQVRRDWLVYAILNSLPWVGRELFDKKEQTVERLMITIDNYMKKRNRAHHNLLRVWNSDDPNPQEEFLDCLWAQIENLKMNGWIEKHINRPYISFDSVLCEALQHNLQQILLPPHHENMRYPMPRVIFRMFDYADCGEGPVLPGAHSIERYLIEQELTEIIRKYHKERRDCAAALLDYEHNNKIPLEYMIVEVIFGQLFNLPLPEYLDIFYGSLLIELCKRQAGVIPQILAQTVELLYERIDSMNVSCIDRFATWFAYHLSNFQFRWGWSDWGSAVNMDPDHPKPKFISEVLLKSIRLSYYERVTEMFPQSMGALLPPPAMPQYKYNGDTGEFAFLSLSI